MNNEILKIIRNSFLCAVLVTAIALECGLVSALAKANKRITELQEKVNRLQYDLDISTCK